MEVLAALAHLGGAARLGELRRLGVARRSLQSAVTCGQVSRPGHGLYCLAGSERDDVTRALSVQGVVSCATAAVRHGLEVFGPAALHVAAPHLRSAPRGFVAHRRQVDHDGRVTTFHQTLRDCAVCLPVGLAVSVLDSALRQGRVDQDELLALVPAHGRDARAIRRAVHLVDPQAQSVLESVARVLLLEDGIGPVESQVRVDQVGWVDLVVEGWLVIEVDGYAVHRDRFAEDRRRDAELVRQGYVVLRFTYRDLLRRPAWVLRTVREALGRHRRAREE